MSLCDFSKLKAAFLSAASSGRMMKKMMLSPMPLIARN
jgi:hypothetical protein